jgi:hypothetical protein
MFVFYRVNHDPSRYNLILALGVNFETAVMSAGTICNTMDRFIIYKVEDLLKNSQKIYNVKD